jgi:hypothetical protein
MSPESAHHRGKHDRAAALVLRTGIVLLLAFGAAIVGAALAGMVWLWKVVIG